MNAELITIVYCQITLYCCSVIGTTSGFIFFKISISVCINLWNTYLVFYKIKLNPQEDDDQKIAVMRKAFQMFDKEKTGFIETIKISTILNTMGQLFDDNELKTIIEQNDPNGKFYEQKNLRQFSIAKKKIKIQVLSG